MNFSAECLLSGKGMKMDDGKKLKSKKKALVGKNARLMLDNYQIVIHV
jgi:hypothetical protein